MLLHVAVVITAVVFVSVDPAQISFMDSYAASTVRLERIAPREEIQEEIETDIAEPQVEKIDQAKHKVLAMPKAESLQKVKISKDTLRPKKPKKVVRPKASPRAMPAFSGNALGAAGMDKSARANILRAPKPPYPRRARSAQFEGEVVVSIDIAKSGKVTKAEVVHSSGRKDCDNSALSTILRYWKFTPAKKAGISIPSKEKVIVEYSLS